MIDGVLPWIGDDVVGHLAGLSDQHRVSQVPHHSTWANVDIKLNVQQTFGKER